MVMGWEVRFQMYLNIEVVGLDGLRQPVVYLSSVFLVPRIDHVVPDEDLPRRQIVPDAHDVFLVDYLDVSLSP